MLPEAAEKAGCRDITPRTCILIVCLVVHGHTVTVIWEKGLGEGQWTLRWEPLGGTSLRRREREFLLTLECLSYGAPTEEDANLH